MSPSLATVSIDQLRLLTKIAVLYHEESYSQAEVSEKLNLSQARVSRYLKHAVELGIVRTSVIQPAGIYVGLEKALEEKYGLREVVVVEMVEGASVENRLGSSAAKYLETTLETTDFIGISSWSNTLVATVEAMRSRPRKIVTGVAQLIGGIGSPQAQAQATRLISHLAELTSARPYYLNAPGIASSHDLQQAFLGDPTVAATVAAWDKLTTLLVGVGTFPASPFFAASGNALLDDEESELASDGAVGEICLRYFDASGSPMHPKIESRMVSIEAAAMLAVPRRIGVAGGISKLSAVRAAITGGWVNVLITDSRLAAELLERPRFVVSTKATRAH
ncbi:MAG: winged helix-turn-helix transcriptional regulator [Candidatus Saccharibacteria bacterium]|nr:winged helix-turn-helix transcriptional regulator [Microbacteriaceae bacterium]